MAEVWGPPASADALLTLVDATSGEKLWSVEVHADAISGASPCFKRWHDSLKAEVAAAVPDEPAAHAAPSSDATPPSSPSSGIHAVLVPAKSSFKLMVARLLQRLSSQQERDRLAALHPLELQITAEELPAAKSMVQFAHTQRLDPTLPVSALVQVLRLARRWEAQACTEAALYALEGAAEDNLLGGSWKKQMKVNAR